ncbi:MAG TPA: hypothetical protein HPP54_02120 [Nitrospinae bacterium]|nr:hypothetical protein [Nitrospinota bacterium]
MAQRDREEGVSRTRRKKGPKKTTCQSSKNEKIAGHHPFNNCGGDIPYLGDPP